MQSRKHLLTTHKLSQFNIIFPFLISSSPSTTHAFSTSSANPNNNSISFHGSSPDFNYPNPQNSHKFPNDNADDLRGKEIRRTNNRVQQNPLVREALKLINLGSRWNPSFEKRLQNLLKILKPEHICEILSSQNDERLSLHFFHWAEKQRPYRHHPTVFYTILKQLSRTKLCQESKKILNLMKNRGLLHEPQPFTYLMLSYSRANNLGKTMQVLTMMHKSGISPDINTYNTALYAMIIRNHVEKALKFLEYMKMAGISPNIITYNSLIQGYCNISMVEHALKLLDEMPFSPDKISYSTIMGFFCKKKMVTDLRDLMVKMEGKSGIVIDQETYIRLIHMFSKHGHGDEAMEFLQEAEGKGFVVDRVGYTAVVDAYCHGGELEKAKKIVGEMSQRGFNPDVVTYTSVVNGMCLAGKMDHAKKMLRHMYESGCRPNTVSYTAFLMGLTRRGRTAEAREVVAASGGWWTPNSITYSVLIHGFQREGKMAEAREVMMEMMSKGFFPTPIEINISIRALCDEGKAEEGKNLLMEFRSKGCHVNVVNYTTVISGFCKEGDVDAAVSLMDYMYLCDKHPDVYTYTAVIGALGKSRRLVRLEDLVVKMLRRKIAPTPTTYRIIIHRYCENDKVDDLLRLLDNMLSRHPYVSAYNHLVEKLCGFGKIELACRLLSKVLTGTSRRNGVTCNLLMKKCLEEEMYEEVYEIIRRMFRQNMTPDLDLCEKIRENLVAEKAERLTMWLVERGIIPTKKPHLV